jgi:uncharacterized membrane protein YtjA (UPF0391 family)
MRDSAYKHIGAAPMLDAAVGEQHPVTRPPLHESRAPKRFRYRRAVPWTFSTQPPMEDSIMIKWAIIFAVISIIAGIFGFTGLAADSAGIAKILFYLALAIFAIFLVLGIFVGKRLSD